MITLREAAQQALGFTMRDFATVRDFEAERARLQDALRAALAQEQAEPDAYGYASRLAVAIWEQHYKNTAPDWEPFDDLMGVLTQIDNMIAGLTRQEQAEPVQELVGAVLVNRESREGVMFYSADMVPDPTTLKDCFELVKVYTAPPKREPLTEGVLMGVYIDFDRTADPAWSGVEYLMRLCRAVERALEEKNRGR